MSTGERYPSDLTDLQWDNIGHLLPQGHGKTGRPRTYPVREVVNEAMYLARGREIAFGLFPRRTPDAKSEVREGILPNIEQEMFRAA